MKKLLFFLSCLVPGIAFANIFDMGDHSGIIRDSNGNYSRVTANGTIRSLTSNTSLQLVEKVPVSTSKGIFDAQILRNVAVDTARIGSTVRRYAVAGGPVGMTIAAVSLICELSDICNVDGVFKKVTSPTGADAIKTHIGWCIDNGTLQCYADKDFDAAVYAANSCLRVANPNCEVDGVTELYSGTTLTGLKYRFRFKSDGSYSPFFNGTFMGTYTPPATTYGDLTASDWNSKESKLNDSRFTPELAAKDQDIPVGTPSLPSPVNVPIDKKTSTTRDQSGNVTGTQEETTTATIDNVPSASNPTGNPSIVNITETTVTNNYNTNNQLTSSTTTTTGGDTYLQPKPEGFTIDFDNSSDTPLENYSVPASFSYTSWGSGQCPVDRSVSYHYGTLNLTFQPACDFAIAMQPAILAIAGFLAMFIIAGVRNND